MVLTREPTASVIDILDRVLDKGIVIDASISFYLMGIDLITVHARVVVASIETYLKYANSSVFAGPIAFSSRPKRQRAATNRRSKISPPHKKGNRFLLVS